MPIIVMKFGGSCLTDKTAFKKILTITNLYKDVKKIFVVSALKGITDLLLKTAQGLEDVKITDKNISIIEKKHLDVIEQIFEEDSKHYIKAKDWIDEKLSELDDAFADIKEFGLEPYYRDYVLSFGEILSTYILNQYLLSCSIESVYIPANKVIITNDEFNNAYPLYELTNSRIRNLLIPLIENPKKDVVMCLTGFIGRNKIGYLTTLGRGGSDYTATILAHSLYSTGNDKNIKVVLWKDVDGLLAINPKYAPESTLIRNLDYDEAKHIANFGAKILHPKCLEAIEKYKIPLEIRNFDKPLDDNFTEISDRTDKNQIKGISVIEYATIITVISASLVDVPGVLAKIFKTMSKNKISVSLVAQSSSEISTSFIVDAEDREQAINALNKSNFFSEFFEIKWEEVAVINITGLKVLDSKTKAEIFNALDKKNVKVKAISQGLNELNLSLVVERKKLIDAVSIIHDDLCEDFET
jgi:aspartate kinase